MQSPYPQNFPPGPLTGGGLFDPSVGTYIDPLTGLPVGALPTTNGSVAPTPAQAPNGTTPTDPSFGLNGVAALGGAGGDATAMPAGPVGSGDYNPGVNMSLFTPPVTDGSFQPPPTPKKENIFERLSSGLKHAIQGDAPAGYSQFLTPDQIEAARPTLLQTLFAGGADPNAFRNNLQQAVYGTQMLPTQIAQQKLAAYQAMRQQQVMDRIGQEYGGSTTGMTPDQMRTRLLQMYDEGVANNAPKEWLDSLQKSVSELDKPGTTKADTHTVSGNQLLTFDGNTGALKSQLTLPSDPIKQQQWLAEHNLAVDKNNREAAQYQDTLLNQKMNNFQTAMRPITQVHQQKYIAFQNNLRAASEDQSPEAQQALLYSFVNITDTNAQMRQGILNKLEKFFGVKTEAELMTARMTGHMPPDILQGMASLVNAAHARLKKQYQTGWDAFVHDNPEAASKYSAYSPGVVFQDDANQSGSDSSGMSSGAAKVQSFLPAAGAPAGAPPPGGSTLNLQDFLGGHNPVVAAPPVDVRRVIPGIRTDSPVAPAGWNQ